MTVDFSTVPSRDSFPELDGSSDVMQRLKHDMACVAADRDITVLVLGESGTGKERVARAIHRASVRSRSPFVVVNCAGLASTLIDDELFGHVRGAFTGAVDDRPGPFERANGGTVFLDEIGDLTLDLQMKLLRVLQERTVQRLGSRTETTVDVRVIAATNVDLAAAIAGGRFREDLFYRLNVFAMVVPPLRARGAADIAALADVILERFAVRRRCWPVRFDDLLRSLLVMHVWPGNVRELENLVERVLVSACGTRVLTRAHVPPGFPPKPMAGTSRPPAPHRVPDSTELRAALDEHGANRTRAAAALGISRHQLYRALRRGGEWSDGCGRERAGRAAFRGAPLVRRPASPADGR
jgi:transcriptional regulator with PAS, ATPase and Fis domain